MFFVILCSQITQKFSNTSCGYIKDYTDTTGMTANVVIKTDDVAKNLNEKLRIHLPVKELNEFFYSFTFKGL